MENIVLHQQNYLKTLVMLPSSSSSSSSSPLSSPKPNLRIFTTKHNMNVSSGRVLLQHRPRMIKVKSNAESNYNSGDKFIRLNVPLTPKSRVGKFLSGVMEDVMLELDKPQKFHHIVMEELKVLKDRRDSALKQMLKTDSCYEDMFQRRTAELEEEKCGIAIQDIMYLLIIFKFYASDVTLVPKISKCIRNGRLELLSDMEKKLKYIQSWELWNAIMEILTSLTFVNTENIEAESSRTVIITKDRFAKMYVACTLYGYFLKSVSLKYQQKKCLSLYDHGVHIGHGISLSALRGSKDIMFFGKQENEIGNLEDYVKGFERPKLVLDDCELRSKEALQLVENHTQALFEHNNNYGLNEFDDDDEFIEASFSNIKRLLWEGLAFGSFLRMAEDFIDGIYKLEEHEVE